MKQIWENRTIILLILLFASCSVAKPIPNIDKVVVFQKFAPGGSTNDIKYDFRHQSTFNDSTPSKSIQVDEKEFRLALTNAKSKRHFQQKIAGISFAGKIFQGDTVHYFIYLKE
ncbi:MAG TPA: hypothetical protein VNV85_18100 [Puia sp.]|jgi:hypothetical protein|nr:hypothetical protein [Puia sp.]